MALEEASFAGILRARRDVYAHLHRTPLHRHPGLCDLLAADVWVKHENHLPGGAFKVRGGVHLALRLSAEERLAGLYTASTGNHGLSIAYGGRLVGAPVTIAVPAGANPAKLAAMRAHGAEIAVHGADFDEAREWIAERARQNGARFIGPAEPELIAGVGTYALEILEELPEVEVIFVPVGGGSGASGCCLVASAVNPAIRVVGVQAELAPAAYLAWRHGEPRPASMATVAEGLATRVPFAGSQEILRRSPGGLHEFVLVSDEAMEEAIRLLLQHTGNLAEHAGAVALAAALEQPEMVAGRRVVLVLSGGNLSLPSLRRILA